MDHPVAGGDHAEVTGIVLEPGREDTERMLMGDGPGRSARQRLVGEDGPRAIGDLEPGLSPDPVDLAPIQPRERCRALPDREHRELDARGAGVDDEDDGDHGVIVSGSGILAALPPLRRPGSGRRRAFLL